jgi:drug/metabolite transporter (DMT)-like permease
MSGLALALGSSLCWGISDFIAGIQARRAPLLLVVLISQGFGLIGVIVVLAARGVAPPALVSLLPAVAAGVAGTTALAAFYRALAVGNMSIVAPISATGVAVPVIVGIATGDHPAALQLAGIAAAVIGVILASREHDGSAHPLDRRATRVAVGLALVAALGFGSFFVGLRASARHDVWWALFAARTAGIVVLGAAALRFRPERGIGLTELPPLAAVGALDLAANVLYAVATRHGILSVVAVGASLYPLATVALARVILGERVRRVQEFGIVAAIAGVAMLAAG